MRLKSLLAVTILVSLFASNTAFARPTGVVMSMSGPSSSDITAGTDDAVLLSIIVTSGMDITFDDFPLTLEASEDNPGQGLLAGPNPNLTDIKIVDSLTGDTVFGPVDADDLYSRPGAGMPVRERGDDRPGHILFEDDLSMEPGGVMYLDVTADISSSADLDGMTINASLPLNSFLPHIIDNDRGRIIPNSRFLIPTATITGHQMTVVL